MRSLTPPAMPDWVKALESAGHEAVDGEDVRPASCPPWNGLTGDEDLGYGWEYQELWCAAAQGNGCDVPAAGGAGGPAPADDPDAAAERPAHSEQVQHWVKISELRSRAHSRVADAQADARAAIAAEQAAAGTAIAVGWHRLREFDLAEQLARGVILQAEGSEQCDLWRQQRAPGKAAQLLVYRASRTAASKEAADGRGALRGQLRAEAALVAAKAHGALAEQEAAARRHAAHQHAASLLDMQAAAFAARLGDRAAEIARLRNEIEPSKKSHALSKKAAADAIAFKRRYDEAEKSAGMLEAELARVRNELTQSSSQAAKVQDENSELKRLLSDALARISALEVEQAKAKENGRALSYDRAELQQLRKEKREREVEERRLEQAMAENRRLKGEAEKHGESAGKLREAQGTIISLRQALAEATSAGVQESEASGRKRIGESQREAARQLYARFGVLAALLKSTSWDVP